jgi:hypothetical protein
LEGLILLLLTYSRSITCLLERGDLWLISLVSASWERSA